MPNIDTAGQGFARGFSRGRDRALMRDQLDQEKLLEEAEAMRTAIANSRTQSLAMFEKFSNLGAQMAESGISEDDERMQQVRRGGMAALVAHGSVLNNLQTSSEESGANTSQFANPAQFVEQHMELFDAGVAGASARAAVVTESSAVREVEGFGEVTVITQTDNTGKQNFFVEKGDKRIEVDSSQVKGATERTQDVAIEPGTKKGLETSIINSGEGLSRLFTIQSQFEPEFVTFGGRIKGAWTDFKEKAGADLSNDEQQFLTEFSTFQQTAFDNLNRFIREMTGAQMSELEAKRLRKGIPDPEKDGPVVFKSKMDASVKQLALVRARAIHSVREGITENPWDAFQLDQIEGIIEKRHAQLVAEGLSVAEADTQVAREFGLR